MLISDRLWLLGIYKSVAAVIKADGIVDEPKITETIDVHKIHRRVYRFVNDGLHGKYAGLADAIDAEVAASLDGKFDREKVVKTFERIAWSGLGGDE
jgi:hypothetical protein